MTRNSLTAGSEEAGRTLADIVRRMLPELSWSQARELCRRGKVRHNGALQRDSAVRLGEGDAVEIDLHAPRVRENTLPDEAIVYLDADVVVVDKPAGMLTVPFEADDKDTLQDQLRAWLRRKFGPEGAELGAVQRLDKDTTGVLVFARKLAAKRKLQQQLRAHTIERQYLALAHGDVPACRSETVLMADRGDGLRGSYGRYRRAQGPAPVGSQRALTHITPRLQLRAATLVECRIETGRQHQIRIHLSELGHPLLGERVYIRDYKGPRIEAKRPMLHAETLGFSHPRTEEELRFQRPPPADFDALMAKLRG